MSNPATRRTSRGHPFVGPAGRVLDDALETAGIDRGAVYVTNAVKHFEWEARGKQRHRDRRVLAVAGRGDRPRTPGGGRRDGHNRGAGGAGQDPRDRIAARAGGRLGIRPPMVATVHPSAIVRVPDRDDPRSALEGMVADLRLALELTAPSATGTRRRRLDHTQ